MLRDRPDVLDAVLCRGSQGEHVGAPDPGVLLLPGDRLGRLGIEDRLRQTGQGFGRNGTRRGELLVGPKPDCVVPVLEQPAEGNPMMIWQFQMRLPRLSSGGAKAARK